MLRATAVCDVTEWSNLRIYGGDSYFIQFSKLGSPRQRAFMLGHLVAGGRVRNMPVHQIEHAWGYPNP